MNSLKNFERMLYSVESNDKLFYPNVNSETFTYMDVEASNNRSKVMCFPYYLHVGEKSYIAIYIWDVLLPEGYKRFVIEKGYSLNTKDEEMFLTYLSDNIQVDCELYDRLVEQVKRDYPDVHLTAYEDIRHTLLHLYYTFHRTGPREILYKANLNYLAAGLEKIDGYNLIGSTPQKIFDVQLGMLRALNSEKRYNMVKK